MNKILPLAMLVSSVACGDTNDYYVNDGDGSSGSAECQSTYDLIVGCDGLQYWEQEKTENFHSGFVSYCGQFKDKIDFNKWVSCLESQCGPSMMGDCDGLLEDYK